MSDAVNQFLKESRAGRYPNAVFDKPGTTVTGTIVGVPRIVTSQFGDALVVDLANPAYPDGGVTVWIKQGMAGAAVADAVGDHGLAEGGVLTLKFTGERDTGKGNPLKLYEAHYVPPVASVDVASIFGQQS